MNANKPKAGDPTGTRPSGIAGASLPLAVGTAAVQVWMDIGTEAVRFVWNRLEQDIKTQQAMLACTSPEEMRQIQTAFFTAAREQYAAEAGRMLELMGKGTAAGLWGRSKGRHYDDVPL